jgi:hypothetical protein
MAGSLTSTFLDSEGSLEITRGESKELELHVTTLVDETEENYDLTGAVIYLTVKCRAKDVENAVQLVSTDSSQIAIDADPRTGKATIHFSPGDTNNLATGTYVFDIVVVSGAERYYILGPSDFTVSHGVTRLP